MNTATRPTHTPGPWTVRISQNGALRGYSIEHQDETLRSIVARNWEHELCEEHGNSLPNARLIAAAPTMFDYLTLLALRGDNEAHEIISKITGP